MNWFNRKRVLDPDEPTETRGRYPIRDHEYEWGYWDAAVFWGVAMFITGAVFGGLLVAFSGWTL